MNKDIKYNGYSAVPSDYECQDGELALSLNLIQENGSIRGILDAVEADITGDPSTDNEIDFNGLPIVCVHIVHDRKNYIIKTPAENGEDATILKWFTAGEGASVKPLHQTPINGFIVACAIGNMIVALSDAGINYFLWKDSDYINLGHKPPFLSISFSLVEQGPSITGMLSGCSFGAVGDFDNYYPPGWSKELDDWAYGQLNKYIAEEVTSKGLFFQPFFVRYAYRLFDGSHLWHSSPILMLPTVTVPICKATQFPASGYSDGRYRIQLDGDVPRCQLYFKLLASESILNELKNWRDIIKGIDIYVSLPIYTYKQESINHLGLAPMNARDFSHFGKGINSSNSIYRGSWSGGSFASIPIDADTLKYLEYEESDTFLTFEKNERFLEQVKTCANFYLLSSLEMDALNSYTSMKVAVPITDKNVSADYLATKPTLEDEYQSHFTLIPQTAYVYNNKLNVAGGYIAPAKPFPLKSMVHECELSTEQVQTSVRIWSRVDGVKCISSQLLGDFTLDSMLNKGDVFYPRYLYVPIPGAYKMEISSSEKNITLDLVAHENLNGAFWFSNKAPGEDGTLLQAIPEAEDCSKRVSIRSKIYTSQINNPFVFPAVSVNSIGTAGTATIYRMATAAKALSQGQFGQFPLYAFTDEGVWAMEVSSNGTYTAKQPITRDVCINPDGITQIDSAVLFPTARGIMLISGSDVECISEIINTQTPFDVVASLPGITQLHKLMGASHNLAVAENPVELDSCIPTQPFIDYIRSCRMIYDYVHQRIIVYNSEYSYSYVFSLSSKRWGMLQSSIKSNVDSYPEALAITHDGRLVNFSKDNGQTLPGLLITRPLKLEGANIHKTIDSIIQRGHFNKGHVKSVLYGSRDLINWHLVWSSKDHYLRGFRGTPYKYFRIALLCNLAPGESIYGASVQFTPRLTNQPR